MAGKEHGRLEHVEYDDYPSSPPSRGSPVATPKMASTTTYSSESLKEIGDLCRNRLPPASAVQAMFLYELQRQTECEELFRGHLFKLAQQENTAAAEKNYIRSLEKRIVSLEKQKIQERVAASDVLVKIEEGKRKLLERRVDTIDQKQLEHDAQLEKLTTQISENDAAIAAQKAEKPATPEPNPLIDIIKQEVDALFVDRDNILERINDYDTKFTRIEENLRALTLQRAPQALAPQAQRLSIKTPNGTPLELGVPKGKAHVGLKENASPRSFSPGSPWK